MPELPEVETTRRGVAPWIEGTRVTAVALRQPQLRWPVPASLGRELPGRRVLAAERRAKYLLFRAEGDRTLMLHLGMSGSLRILQAAAPPGRHDHMDLVLEGGRLLRFHDPRRFGSADWIAGDPLRHPLLCELGPEPLGPGFSPEYLAAACRGRRIAIKQLIMNGRIVVGVGNIYASEALFRAGIHPLRAAGRIGAPRLAALVTAIREVLEAAIRQGGTTLRDFAWGDGQRGYFRPELAVYDRAGEPCLRCAGTIRAIVQGQRSSYYCAGCQR
ncbi:bifunctional DNA-formamidopyrimidine glycosylase/DNA-(apurinic or apyrimidinic site) lyase [Wenzhouxiangella sp. XN24]|uniref:bifunctional DNA-formamidopyrimidine glycosylase/DNA-(apurinic or apyrimidinic site) lyase n=1 Tax=Wenzhouxiangella sp. XN24 TaxID=2713569 RepID=UPI0013ED5FE6|nr:bifunctional DNA-formamidopyrimidine glycosylase/DNA-(apurinic or apyrimidinic site) lyase [Wenzhouxiangella sp. XN24]NGX17612.1 bifunctional DNA-formamidopyrimidine glycosylase/DNA-(apurinic or apyrimidinic site) lyase [Wenzhouxiangella sp. XN24]